MEAITCHVRDIHPPERQALERLVGRPLDDNQRVSIQVLEPSPTVSLPDSVPDSWNVYEGLSEEQIDQLDQVVRQRANLSRSFE